MAGNRFLNPNINPMGIFYVIVGSCPICGMPILAPKWSTDRWPPVICTCFCNPEINTFSDLNVFDSAINEWNVSGKH